MEEGQKEINLREHWPQKAWDGKEKYEVKIMKYERISHKMSEVVLRGMKPEVLRPESENGISNLTSESGVERLHPRVVEDPLISCE